MTTKHTPGPWRISGCWSGNSMLIEHGNSETYSPLIAEVYAGKGSPMPQEANARLIAAAPDLLAACKFALSQMESVGLLCGDVHAAIAKADGN